MTDKAWKQFERRVASVFGTVRTPLSGGTSRITRSDTLHKKLFIESKSRKKIPFLKTFKDVLEMAKVENKIPLMVIHEKNSQMDLLICRLKDVSQVGCEQQYPQY